MPIKMFRSALKNSPINLFISRSSENARNTSERSYNDIDYNGTNTECRPQQEQIAPCLYSHTMEIQYGVGLEDVHASTSVSVAMQKSRYSCRALPVHLIKPRFLRAQRSRIAQRDLLYLFPGLLSLSLSLPNTPTTRSPLSWRNLSLFSLVFLLLKRTRRLVLEIKDSLAR